MRKEAKRKTKVLNLVLKVILFILLVGCAYYSVNNIVIAAVLFLLTIPFLLGIEKLEK